MTEPVPSPTDSHPFPFDPTYGYDEARLRTVPAPPGPNDFAIFWQQTYAETRALPLKLTHREITSPLPEFETHEIEFDTLGGVRTGGWLTRPRQGSIEFGLVIGHGYGGRDCPHFEPGAVAIAPCARGFNRSARLDIPGEAMRHVLHGIARRETYSHRGSVSELWSAASALLELHPELSDRLFYSGTSFGGGIGAMALPWDARFRKAFLDVPSFGNHPLRVQLPCIGSGAAIRSYHRKHPEVLNVLAYFDAATAARHITIPVLVSAALFDPAVPPPGQFAIYNGLTGPKELFVRQAGHFEGPWEITDGQAIQARLTKWWRS